MFRTAQNLALDYLRARRVRSDHARQNLHETDLAASSRNRPPTAGRGWMACWKPCARCPRGHSECS